ncbi:MAG: 5-formyltetrahydrofolate cyclo-ligase [Thalassobaculum sp.]|uniref:5-formyltetrahydrofolate cyclo-ligase n=1 Tax=Thalassobaculum sp. TaxID=2022740 RepID=UPI0032EBEEF0
MQGRADVMAWRRETRRRLIDARLALPVAERDRLAERAVAALEAAADLSRFAVLGLYWPFRGEIDLRPLARRLIDTGTRIGLPVVVAKDAPVEFREWHPDAPMTRGVWNIPIPDGTPVVHPAALVVPLVGFDARGYRLGYGGGYYDRTLAARRPHPWAIGLGFDLGRLDSIHPFDHDIPMDGIVTESGATRHPRGEPGSDAPTAGFASPACLLAELDPADPGPWR